MSDNVCKFFCSVKRFKSSANVIEERWFKELGRSFIYSKKSGPKNEPCGIP